MPKTILFVLVICALVLTGCTEQLSQGVNEAKDLQREVEERAETIVVETGKNVAVTGEVAIVEESSLSTFVIPEVSLEISFPKNYSIGKNGELNRRGSFVSYDFSIPGKHKWVAPSLNEIQFFSRESIEAFTADCETTICFFGDYPDLKRYDGQKEAFLGLEDYEDYKLRQFNDRYYFISSRDCHGDSCVIREYTTFIDNDKIDIWITMEDESQNEKSDELFSQLQITEVN